MEPAPIPHDDDQRLAALRELAILDTPPEELFDRCLKLAAELCGVSRGAVSLVDRERQWFKAIYGELPRQTPREVSFCGHAVAHDDVLVVNDAAADPRFADNPLVARPGGIRFYAGIPLHASDGRAIGTLCVMHDAPSTLSRAQLASLRVIAEHLEEFLMLRLVALHAAAQAKDARAEREVLQELEARRRQTTAMLVHDLRNPLAVVTLIAEFVQKHELPKDVADALADLAASADVAQRMVCDILDVSTSESGDMLATMEPVDLPKLVLGLTRRLQYLAAERGQTIQVGTSLREPVLHADAPLISRALRNFLDNAFTHGPPNTAIRVVLRDHGDDVDLRVEDDGPPVPAELREQVFDAYFHSSSRRDRPSHGLGLAFCAKVAQAHGGKAWVEPGPGGSGNAFVLRIRRR